MIINWYKVINQHFSTLMLLLQNEPDQVKHTLDVLKCGLFSKNAELAITACQILTRVIVVAIENDLEDLRFNYLEWLTMTKKQPKVKPPKSPAKNPKYGSEKKQKPQFEHLLTEAGLKAFIRAYNRHYQYFIEPFGTFLKQAGKDSYIDLITNHLRLQSESNFNFLGIIQDLHTHYLETGENDAVFIESGVLNILIDICYTMADSNYNSTFTP